MSRPLRIEFSGALYHVTSRGNARGAIYFDDTDRRRFLELLGEVCNDYNWACHAYCLMDNHYHLLLETGDATLSKGMRQLNGVYTQYFNRTHRRVGHLYQGRYKAILVEEDAYLLELSRYIVLNPVRARMVRIASEWPWSSYHTTAGLCCAKSCLFTDKVLSLFGGDRAEAQRRYEDFVAAGANQPSPWDALKNQVYLGSDVFMEHVQCKLDTGMSLKEIPKAQKRGARKELTYYDEKYKDRDVAMLKAYRSQYYTMAEIGGYFGVSYSTVSRSISKAAKCKT